MDVEKQRSTVAKWLVNSRKDAEIHNDAPGSRQHFDVWEFANDGVASSQRRAEMLSAATSEWFDHETSRRR